MLKIHLEELAEQNKRRISQLEFDLKIALEKKKEILELAGNREEELVIHRRVIEQLEKDVDNRDIDIERLLESCNKKETSLNEAYRKIRIYKSAIVSQTVRFSINEGGEF